MTGLEAILNKIIEDAEATAASRVNAARNRASLIESEHLAKAESNRMARLADAASQAERLQARGHSAAKTALRNALLAERNLVINEVIDEAFRSLSEVPAEEAFDQITSYVVGCPAESDVTVILSATDLARMPADFAGVLSAKTNKTVTIRPEPGVFRFGCVVVAGEIEYNGTAEGILYDRRDELRDLVYRILFAAPAEGDS